MKKWLLLGTAFIIAGLVLVGYYDCAVKPDRKAQALLTEGKMIFERGSRESINRAIDVFTKVIANYPDTETSFEAYYMIAQSYEKLDLNRLAYLKYIYILKNNRDLTDKLTKEIKARIARLKILKRYDEEGIHYLLTALNYSEDNDFRSRVYTELGHTFLKKSQYRRSLRMFDLAMKENGENEEAVIGKARAYKRLGMDSNAYNMYDHFLKYYGNFSYYTNDVVKSYDRQLYSSGLNSFKRGRYYPAIAFFRKYISKFPGERKTENALYWIGESFFALKKYNSAVKYFSRVRSNGYYHKDEDAYIKTGYAYFMAKNYELATKQFQGYIEDYPNGKYRIKAKEWKRMSNKELIYKFNSSEEKNESTNSDDSSYNDKDSDSRTVQAKYREKESPEKNLSQQNYNNKEDFVNVAEL